MGVGKWTMYSNQRIAWREAAVAVVENWEDWENWEHWEHWENWEHWEHWETEYTCMTSSSLQERKKEVVVPFLQRSTPQSTLSEKHQAQEWERLYDAVCSPDCLCQDWLTSIWASRDQDRLLQSPPTDAGDMAIDGSTSYSK
jgi:hypothetical protein